MKSLLVRLTAHTALTIVTLVSAFTVASADTPTAAANKAAAAQTPTGPPVLCTYQSSAVAVARSHIEAWSRKDWVKAQDLLAPDIHVTVTTTTPGAKGTDTVGVDQYMNGLKQFAGAIVPNSTHIVAALGDKCNAMILVTVQWAIASGGPPITITGARLYLLNDEGKIRTEQVIFY